jgi:aldehyde:ferredoxin oxidoreductase
LTSGATSEEKVSARDAIKNIGGRGLAIKVLVEGMDPKADPLSPENLLVFATVR